MERLNKMPVSKQLTVKELINELRRFNENSLVYFFTIDEVEGEIPVCRVFLDHSPEGIEEELLSAYIAHL